MIEEKFEETDQGFVEEMDNIYISLEDAKKEIWRRWNDHELRRRVDTFLNNDIPELFKDSPRAVLARQVASPNFEAMHFMELSKNIGLRGLCLEYLSDKFVAENIDKYYLGKIFFHRSNNRNENSVESTLKVVNFDNIEGKSINALKTIWDGGLVEFHHELMSPLDDNFGIDTYDISEHYKRNGLTADKYYTYFFSIYICYGVLFENYLLDERQSNFTMNVVLPNYKKVSKIFGLNPLVVRLGPVGEEDNLYWRYYPTSIYDKIKKITNKK